MEWISKCFSYVTVQNLDGLTFYWSTIRIEDIKVKSVPTFLLYHWFLDHCVWLWNPEQLITDFPDVAMEIYK